MPDLQSVLIDGEWRPASSVSSFTAVNPATGEQLPGRYPISSYEDVDLVLAAGHEAARQLRSTAPSTIAEFLDLYADGIEKNREAIIEAAHLETGLPAEPRLDAELPRTTDQLRQAAAAVRDRSWVTATIDTGSNIRSMYGPLGAPVLVFGPNNFPIAFNAVSGGDFAAAISAGNPVIAMAHRSHPRTCQLLAEAASWAVEAAGAPAGLVQFLFRLRREDGLVLATEPRLGAIGFTGSKNGGLALKAAADAAGTPIYLEMGSVNPVFILSGALRARGAAIAEEFFGSCLLGAGQYCTNPGLVVLPRGDEGDRFVDDAVELFASASAGTLLGPPDNLSASVATLRERGAEVLIGGSAVPTEGYWFENTLLQVSGEEFLSNADALQTEAFGPTSLFVRADGIEEMAAIAAAVHGNLTGSIYTDPEGADDAAYGAISEELRTSVGRLLNDKMPTGVAVVPAMNHGGPYPATGHPGFTSVGIPASIHRFAALHCYDNVPQRRLPPELRDENPGSMYRCIDGDWSRGDAS